MRQQLDRFRESRSRHQLNVAFWRKLYLEEAGRSLVNPLASAMGRFSPIATSAKLILASCRITIRSTWKFAFQKECYATSRASQRRLSFLLHSRGTIIGNEFSGWLVLNIPKVKEGIIILKLEPWYTQDTSTITKNWTTVNDQRQRLLRADKYAPKPQPDSMFFDFAIDGKITSLPRDTFLDALKRLDRTVHLLTVLDDPNFTSEAKDVEVAIRMRGCGRDCTFGFSHVYWA